METIWRPTKTSIKNVLWTAYLTDKHATEARQKLAEELGFSGWDEVPRGGWGFTGPPPTLPVYLCPIKYTPYIYQPHAKYKEGQRLRDLMRSDPYQTGAVYVVLDALFGASLFVDGKRHYPTVTVEDDQTVLLTAPDFLVLDGCEPLL